MAETIVVIKVDVDTDRGTRIGVSNLVDLFDSLGIKATFLFSLGPDNTGRAIRRIFRRGFLKKVMRTGVVGTYGLRTLLNGVLWPGPYIGRNNRAVMLAARDRGHEVGIHCYDHVRWQDGLAGMSRAEVFSEFEKARAEFVRIFGEPARVAGAAGWQANPFSLEAYDAADLLCGSDARGDSAFFPRVADRVYGTLQIPTTLPTLDELLGRPAFPQERLIDHYSALLRVDRPNVLTAHAEIEGMSWLDWFGRFLRHLQGRPVSFTRLGDLAAAFLADRRDIPVCDLFDGKVDGRSGTVARQRAA